MTGDSSSAAPRRVLAWPAVLRELHDLALPFTGEPSEVVDLSWDHGESEVWRVSGPLATVAVKAHRQRRKFDQELTAYSDWLPALPAGGAGPCAAAGGGAWVGAPGVRTPRLLAHREEHPRALVLSWEPGVVLEGASPDRGGELRLRQRAGAFLRALHDLPYRDVDPVAPAAAYAARLDAWSQRSRGVVPEAVVASVRASVEEALPLLAVASRVPCHRDYTPRNWLVAEDGALVVVDLEHARPDLRLADLERLWSGEWRRDPALREAFLAGYGRELTADEEGTLRRLSALGALSTVAWAREHGDVAFEERGWDVLRWLGLAGD